MPPLRIGIVGAGIMGDMHGRVFARQPDCQVAAVCDPVLEKAQALAGKLGVPAAFGACETMLAAAPVDVVSICTPDFAHAAPAIAAIEAGKHVLVEKPLAVTVADAEAIIASARTKGVVAMAQFSHRWIPAYRQAHDLLAGGSLGEPVLACARKNDRIFVPTAMITWASRTTPAWFLSAHDIDLVCWCFDLEPVEVYASAVRKVLVARGIDTPDAVHAQVRFAGGAVAAFEACWTYPDTFPTMTDSFLELITTGAVIHLDRKREQIEIATARSFEYPRNLLLTAYEEGELGGAVVQSLRHFVRCVRTGGEPSVTLESSLRVTRILDAIQRSIDSGGPVKV